MSVHIAASHVATPLKRIRHLDSCVPVVIAPNDHVVCLFGFKVGDVIFKPPGEQW